MLVIDEKSLDDTFEMVAKSDRYEAAGAIAEFMQWPQALAFLYWIRGNSILSRNRPRDDGTSEESDGDDMDLPKQQQQQQRTGRSGSKDEKPFLRFYNRFLSQKKKPLDQQRKEAKTICVDTDTAKEILAQRTKVKVFEPSRGRKTTSRLRKASASTSASRRRKNRYALKSPRQELTKVSKQDLNHWLDFAKEEIQKAINRDETSCDSSISSSVLANERPERRSSSAPVVPATEVTVVTTEVEQPGLLHSLFVRPFCGACGGSLYDPPQTNIITASLLGRSLSTGDTCADSSTNIDFFSNALTRPLPDARD